MSTPLYPTFDKRTTDAISRILNEQVEPWFFMQQRLSVKRIDGRSISYEGVGFEGSPRLVFWSGYIEPFLYDLIVKELAAAVSASKERDVDARELIPEIQGLLLSGCHKVLARMAEVDRRLLGKGYPQNVPLRDIQPELTELRNFLDQHASAELKMWKPRPAYERWYERNKFWVWAVGLVVAIASLAAKFI